MKSPKRLSNEEIGKLVSQSPITPRHPWCTNDWMLVDEFYRQICAEITRSTGATSRIEWNHYGSGYASYIDAWFYKPSLDFAVPSPKGWDQWYLGVAILLSRLSPYFALMEGQKCWDPGGGSSYMPYLESIDLFTRPATEALASEIRALLEQHNLQQLHRDELSPRLPAGVRVPTILSDPPYTVFDAVFHWED